MLLDQAGELIADVMTANRSLANIPSASAILDTSNYTFHAISYGKDADGFKHHAHEILNITTVTVPSQKTLVLLGGIDSSQNYNTNNYWQISGSDWVSISTTGSPTFGDTHAVAYDSYRGVLVAVTSNASSINTWELSGSRNSLTWKLASTSGPSSRYHTAMAFDSTNNRILLFGGSQNYYTPYGSFYNDLWSWDGYNWTQLVTTNNPQSRALHEVCYDSNRNRLVLFGGINNSQSTFGNALSGTWELNISTNRWANVSTSGPDARYGHGLVYDKSISKTLLIGGMNLYGIQGGVWAWDGTNWSLVTQAPLNGIAYHGTTYNPETSSTFIFGGISNSNPGTYLRDVREFKYTRNPQWTLPISQPINGPQGLVGATLNYFDYLDSYAGLAPGSGIIRVLSYESPSVSSYHTSATASALSDTYKLLPNSIKPLDTRLESKSTITAYSTNVPDVGQCLNSYLNSSLSSYSNLIGCFPAASGSNYWIISSTTNPSINLIISGTLSSVYNQQKIMDSSGFLTFAPGPLSAQNKLYENNDYFSFLSGALRTVPVQFPEKIRIAWGLYPGDAGSLLLFGGIYHVGLWYLDLKEMLKQGYYPPYNFNALNNIRKYKLFAKKTFNKDLLYLNDSGSNSGFKSVFEQNGLSVGCIRYIWDMKFY